VLDTDNDGDGTPVAAAGTVAATGLGSIAWWLICRRLLPL